jgi:hypothetical protein
MKRLLFILAVLLYAWGGWAANYYRHLMMLPRAVAVAGASAPSITVDMWQDFEFDGAVSAASLNANDHTAAGSWSVSANQSSVWTTVSDEKTTTSSINSTADTGTRGLRRSFTNAATSYVQYTLPAVKTNVSVGFWYRAPNTPAWAGGNKLVYAYPTVSVKFTQQGTASQPKIVLGYGGSEGTASSALTPNSWYWVTAKFVKGGTCSCTVYDSTGAAIATQPGNVTSLNNNIESLIIGDNNAHITANTFDGTDDVVADWTTATYPLGP